VRIAQIIVRDVSEGRIPFVRPFLTARSRRLAQTCSSPVQFGL